MPLKLYFCNEELRSCWPVKNVNGQPTQLAITRKSAVFRNLHNYSMTFNLNNGGAGNGTIILPGTALRAASIAQAASVSLAIPTANPFVALGALTLAPSDEVAQADLRQSDIDFTHWQVPVTAATEGDPTFVLISMDQYPDGYSNEPPSWWVDPNP